jgi:hypothetical protein
MAARQLLQFDPAAIGRQPPQHPSIIHH